MNKILALTTLLSVSVNVWAAGANTRVLTYECEQMISAEKDGFTCSRVGSGIGFHLKEDLKTVSEKRRDWINYRRDTMIVRLYDLGGKFFFLRNNDWDYDKRCSFSKREAYRYSCKKVEKKQDH